MTDTRKYMILVEYVYQPNNSLEIWDYNLKKEAVPERIQELKESAYVQESEIERIYVCEHTSFIKAEV